MPVIKFNGSTNYNASDIARRAQGRTVFANSLVNQKSLDNTCLNRVVAGPSAATSYSGSKIIDQRVGTIFTTGEEAAEIVLASPCTTNQTPTITYPNYVLQCSDPLGIQIMATGTFTKFTFTTTTTGAGVLEFQFFSQNVYVSNQLVVLGVDSNLITVPTGIDEVRYIFKCNPIEVILSCGALSKVLQWTNPYKFTNPDTDPSGEPLTLLLYPHPSGAPVSSTVNPNETVTPSPAWGYDSWSISPCLGSLVFPGSIYTQLYLDPAESVSLGAGDFTVEWYQYYDSSTKVAFPTVFSYGTYNNNLLVQAYFDNGDDTLVYYENTDDGIAIYANIPDPFLDTWVHFAICRSAGVVYMYQNGYLIGQDASTADLSTSEIPLTIGNEEDAVTDTTPFQGKMTNFRLVKGVALYPGGDEFTPPSAPLLNVPGTQLLLLATTSATYLTDSSSANREVNNLFNNVEWSSEHP
jgi:hypothetical protein